MEGELAAGLGEGQIGEFVEDDEVQAGELICEPALAAIAGLGLEAIDEIDDVVEPAARTARRSEDTQRRDGEIMLASPWNGCSVPGFNIKS